MGGIEQSAKKFRAAPSRPTHIICSPFARCIQTASVYAQELGIDTIAIDAVLCEALEPSLGTRGQPGFAPPTWTIDQLQSEVPSGCGVTVIANEPAILPMESLRSVDVDERDELNERVTLVGTNLMS